MKKKRVLIVEDEKIIAVFFKELLEMEGDVITENVLSGEDALEFVNNNFIPDLILMDIFLEGQMDGIETVREIQNIHYNLPVIFVTANTDKETAVRALETEPVGYLTKPVEAGKLLMLVRKTFKNENIEKTIVSA